MQHLLLGLGFTAGMSTLGAVAGYAARTPAPPGSLTHAMDETPVLGHEWRLRNSKHWQIVSSPSESQEATDAAEGNRGTCGPGMIEVQGNMKLDPSATAYFDHNSVEEMQKTTCTKWITKEFPERCAEFNRDKWLSISKELPTKPMHFCIDRFEYPNQKGAYPWILISYYEAVDICADEGKRLCNEQEWTFACEGEEATPYPYGYSRDATACVIDRNWRPFHESALRQRDGLAAEVELDRLWQGVPSGSMPRCKSPFGVYDMTGNVDEWTHTSREGERPSILKGGYWGPVRTRCRPSTRSHDENHMFYQQGIRCCTDPGVVPVRKSSADDGSRAPLPREIE
ncbi:MAG: SUMF1/EgtB/PvdO family nonheme iron enzyme [Byssovorax sp.]